MKTAASLRRQIIGAVVPPPLLLCLSAAVTLAIVVRLGSTLDGLAHGDRVIARAAAASRLLDEEEEAPGGSRRSAPEGAPGPYNKAGARLAACFEDLGRLVAADPEQSRVLALVRKQEARWAEFAGRVAGARPGSRDDQARARELMNAVRIFLSAFLDAEIVRRDRLGDEARLLAGSVLPGSAGGGAVLILLVCFTSARRLLRLGGDFEDFQAQADRQERERLVLLSEAMKYYAIFTLDAEGRVSGWNQDTERLLGYRPDDVLARDHSCLFEDEDRRRDMPQKALTWAVREGRAEDIRWITRKDGFRFQARVAIVAIRDAAGVLRGFTTVIHELEEGDA